MAVMGEIFDVSTAAKRFRLFAVAEAITWVGLLIGMAFKWIPNILDKLGVLTDPQWVLGVKIFGPVHGTVFIVYVLVTLVVSRELEWSRRTLLLALGASIPPFATVWFERWAVRTDQLGELSANGRGAAAAPSNAS
ncbi:DUF3817 domain-containing protein [Nocardia caishijiensis]|uniref:Integral membrane protein n=1 Tax=Nocardia caishijiensis TaxID=184756 RepID=A0ABQ6YEF8_9NOCA|nr:DUF3817 domain-containing protein [Nocardia caishijiensis]KAF0835802.1 integral membrane protein [Nocardia caishijiensis]